MDRKGTIRYHMEQLGMQLGSLEHKVETGRLTAEMLKGYLGELTWQISALEEVAETWADEEES